MKNLIFATVIFLGIFTLAGCQNITNLAKGGLKPGDVSPDKPVAVRDLIDGVFTDKDAWKGKEVAVTGTVSASSGAGGKYGYALTLKNDSQASGGDSTIGCYVPNGDIPPGILGKNVEVKGTVDFIRDQGKNVSLKNCTLIK
jgi:hypothetical protein